MNGYLDNKAVYKGEVNTFSDMTDEQFETFFAPHKEAGMQAGIRIHQMQIPYTFTKTRENKPSTDWDGFIRGLRDIEFSGVINFEESPVVSSFPTEMKKDVLAFIAKIGSFFLNQISFTKESLC